jgi:putative Mg2+ transporter-C (MgtC) family protein
MVLFTDLVQPMKLDWLEQGIVATGAAGRLLFAAFLGGVIGLQREVKRKDAGVRTNLLICMGSAFFTILSIYLAGDSTSNKGQVAANIVQGIGFLGAGLILHNRSRVSGLTSAASVWVVASIGMACGAGLYVAAGLATVTGIFALELVGLLEHQVSLKGYPLIYEARGTDPTLMMNSILDAMDKTGERLSNVEHDTIGDLQRVSFSLTASRKQHESLRGRLSSEPAINAVHTFRDPEAD